MFLLMTVDSSLRTLRYGQTNIFVYLGICSLVGSMSVQSCKALGIALKITFRGDNQMGYDGLK